MIIGLLRVEILIPGCHSLKDKRSVLKKHLHRIRRHYNVSVAETGLNDKWRRAELAFCCVGSLRDSVERNFRSVIRELETGCDIQLIHQQSEML